MITRRDFLERSLYTSSLVALGSTVPGFVANAAEAAKAGKEQVLVIVQLNGGNDGLNTVVPFDNDEYKKARPTLALTKRETIRIADGIGLNNSLRGFADLHQEGSLAVVQGVGYPNPNRSHFESMDIWNSADPTRKRTDGWVGRGLSLLKSKPTGIAAFHIGDGDLPLAMKGSATAVPSLNTSKPFGLDVGGEFIGQQLGSDSDGEPTFRESPNDHRHSRTSKRAEARKKLIQDVSKLAPAKTGGLLDFVKQTSLSSYTSIERLQQLMKEDFRLPEGEYRYQGGRYRETRSGLVYELNLVARMIQAGFGTRIFYLTFDGFDTHGSQRGEQDKLLQTLGRAVNQFFAQLNGTGDGKRVLLLTFSEFGRRVRENGSKGTDHGSGSCLFVAGPSVKAGLIGKHPSLEPGDLDRGDLKFHTDFRRVYATLLDQWLICDSRRVLGERFQHLPLLDKPAV